MAVSEAGKVPANIRLIHILETLMKDVVRGMTIQEICEAMKEKYHTIHRDLSTLQEYGYVKEDRGKYCVEPKFMGMALAFYEQMQAAQHSLLALQQQSLEQAKKLTGVYYEYGNN